MTPHGASCLCSCCRKVCWQGPSCAFGMCPPFLQTMCASCCSCSLPTKTHSHQTFKMTLAPPCSLFVFFFPIRRIFSLERKKNFKKKGPFFASSRCKRAPTCATWHNQNNLLGCCMWRPSRLGVTDYGKVGLKSRDLLQGARTRSARGNATPASSPSPAAGWTSAFSE